ncbi:MAG: Bcr/CflA family efflux MFS transporter [Rickettsiales bacterium]|nr:MAG: Bcr/CflA family efflux MFS transporter [Rickettsiales bacterium]
MSNLNNYKLLVILTFIACLTGFTADIYIPSFIKMSNDLNAPIESIQRSMSIFILAVSISQLIYGPVSEIIGRRKPLIIGTIIVFLGSIICFFASDINILLIGRFLQGIGAGACACLWRSIFRDSFTTDEISKYGGYLGIVMVFIVAASPALGGVLESYFNWHASFVAIIIYSFITLMLTSFVLKETNTQLGSGQMNITFFKNAFIQLLTSRIFMGYSLCVFLTYGAFFSWIISSSVLLIDNLGITPKNFGLINLFLGGSSMILGGIINGKILPIFGRVFVLRFGWSLMFLSGVMLIGWNMFYNQSLISLGVFIFIFLFGATFIWPSSFAGAFAPFGSIAGCAGSLYSCMQLGGGAVIGWLCTFMPTKNSNSLAMIFIITSAISWFIFEFFINKNNDN